ncbi:UDP-N-acetylglucosamine 2-epimerase [Salinarimonas sp.]|uniref:UDP-N-acetylglucosamine 2-epimerase n=1 Tax=Salinarimonas sp. TaxID=2766526 RepID=UPI0032D8D997
MRRICVIVTARPSYARVKTALEAMRDHPAIDLQIVVAASALLDRYGRVVDVIRKDGFEVAAEVYSVLEGGAVAQSVRSVGIGLIELASVLSRLEPDAVVTIADRYETIANAIAASFMNLPLVHIQGGEFTGSIDNKVRHAITKLADVHLVASELARHRVVSMGEDPRYVINTGCPSVDLAAEVARDPGLDFDPFERYTGTGPSFDLSGGYVVVLQHPVTTEHDDAFEQARISLDAVRALGKPVFWFWPNVDAGSDGTSKALRMFREREGDRPFHFFKNMLPQDFLRLIVNSDCLIGNSSVGIRESAFLGVPVVNIGTRQNGRERGPNVADVAHDVDAIRAAATRQIAHGRYPASHIYGDGRAGVRIAEELARVELTIEKRDFLVPAGAALGLVEREGL